MIAEKSLELHGIVAKLKHAGFSRKKLKRILEPELRKIDAIVASIMKRLIALELDQVLLEIKLRVEQAIKERKHVEKIRAEAHLEPLRGYIRQFLQDLGIPSEWIHEDHSVYGFPKREETGFPSTSSR